MSRKKIIIDTDTGVDDAMAILMALEAHRRDAVEVLAITSVTGNCLVHNAEINILRTLDAAGCSEIPVHRGAHEALVVPYINTDNYHGLDGFNDVVFPDTPDKSRVKGEPAWEVISRLSKQFPGDITLIAIGPLTNVAIALLADPGLSTRLGEVFIMGGNIEGIGNVTECAEFNFYADPEAAHTVLRLLKCPTSISSWELSYKYNQVDFGWRKQVLGSIKTKAATLINSLEEVWFSNDWPWGNNWILCDQLAMVAALYPESVLEATEEVATVELQGGKTRGMMILDQKVATLKSDIRRNVRILRKLDTEILKTSLHRAFSLK